MALYSETVTFSEQLDRTGRLVYTNKGVSMLPLLRQDRDLMVIEKCDPQHLKRLDAVLFQRRGVSGSGRYVMHRILRINDDGSFWIVGDNCISGENVSREQILGKLTAFVRDGKKTPVTDKWYLLYVNTWCRFYRLRCVCLRIRHFVWRCLAWVKRHISR